MKLGQIQDASLNHKQYYVNAEYPILPEIMDWTKFDNFIMEAI